MKRLPLRQLFTIAALIAAMVAVLVLKRRCGETVGTMFKVLDAEASDAGARRGADPDAAPLRAPIGLDTP